MKKVVITLFAAVAMLAVVSCKNNQPAEAAQDEAACTVEETCAHKCVAEGDSTKCCQMDSTKACCQQGGEKACCKEQAGECPNKANN